MKIKKLLALLLAMVMVLSMAACSDSEDKDGEETIVGTWQCEIDMSNYMNEYFASSGTGYEDYMKFEDLTVVVLMTFEEDGTAIGSLDESSVDALAANLQQTFTDGMLKIVEEQLTQSNPGMTLEEALEASGLSKDELLEQIGGLIDTDYMIESLMGSFTHEGDYTVDGDRLYRYEDEEKYDVFELDGDTLTLLECGGSDSGDDAVMVEEFYPMVFTRVNE